MRCKGNFIFKSIAKRDGGSFTNDRNELVKYNDCYILKVDEVKENGIFEKRLKFSCEDTELFDKLKKLEPYTPVQIEFDVILYASSVSIFVVDVIA